MKVQPFPVSGPESPISGRGTRLPRKWGDAIEALLDHWGTAAQARAAGVSAQTLRHWKQLPAFEAAFRAARRARMRQAMAHEQYIASCATRSLIQKMHHSKDPEIRRQAAQAVHDLAIEAAHIEDAEAVLAELKAAAAPETARPHARLSRRDDRLVEALLKKCSIAAAADAAGVSRQTIYRRMEDAAFVEGMARAVREVWGESMHLVEGRIAEAVSIRGILALSDKTPEKTQLRTALQVVRNAKADRTDDLSREVAQFQAAAEPFTGKAPITAKTVGLRLLEKVQRLKDHLGSVCQPGLELVLVPAVNGRPARAAPEVGQAGPEATQPWQEEAV